MKVVVIGECLLFQHISELKRVVEVVEHKEIVHEPHELIKVIGDAEIVVSALVNISKEVINGCPNLKLISLATTGFDDVDLKVAEKKGVKVCYCPGYSTGAVAEHTISLMLATSRRMLEAADDLKAGTYEHCKYIGKEITGRALGVVGMGRIGTRVAEIAKNGFGMHVVTYDKDSKSKDLEKLLKESDFISLHIPLTKETKNMLGKKEFAMMRKGVVIINTARGGIIDDNALLEALNSGQVFAAGLDVLENEPMHPDNPLIKHPRVIVTPHMAYNSEQSRYARSKKVQENILNFIKGKDSNLVCKD